MKTKIQEEKKESVNLNNDDAHIFQLLFECICEAEKIMLRLL